ncbi:MAG TPA: hypothetical protein VF257_19160 [Solirubrobacteraceae bacterium]
MTDVREQAAQQAQQARGQVREQLRTQVDQRSTQAGERIAQQADDVRTVAQQLREQGKEPPARMAEQVAERAERAGKWLQESDGDRILGDVEDFGRRNPWAVAAGGAAIGFALSRMLKASSSQRYDRRSQGNGSQELEPRFGRTTPSTPSMPAAGPGATAPSPGTMR